MASHWDRSLIRCSDINADVLVFNRKRIGSYRDQMETLPFEIQQALAAGELELVEDLSNRFNKFVLRSRTQSTTRRWRRHAQTGTGASAGGGGLPPVPGANRPFGSRGASAPPGLS